MKLSTKGRYAVMAMVDVAAQSTDGAPVSLSEISERQEISVSYLEQLFCKLRKNGLVESTRGPRGGYVITRRLSDTRISDIILAVDEPISVTRCTKGSPVGCTSDKSRCLTHDLWEELTNHIYMYLSSVSLQDILEKRVLGSGGAIFRRGQLDPKNIQALMS